MPVGSFYAGKEIADWWRDRFNAELKAELGLKAVASAALDDYPADAFADLLPAVLVTGRYCDSDVMGINYDPHEDVYSLRALLLTARVEAAGEHQEKERYRIQRLADVVRAYHRMAGIATLPAGVGVHYAHVVRIDFRPPEDNFQALAAARVVVTALDFKVRCESTISP